MSEPESPAEQPLPPTAPGPERPARLADAVLLCVVFLAAQLVLGFVAGAAGLVAGVPLTNLVMAILEAGSFFAVLPLARRRLRSRVLPLFRTREPALPVYLCVIVMVIGAVPALAVLESILNGIFPVPDFLRSVDVFLLNPNDRLGALLLAVLAAPVFEEILFRGIILRGLAITRGVVGGLLASALLFAVVHINPLQLPAAFLLGILLGLVFLRTGSLVASMVMHGLYNAGALAVAWIPLPVTVWITAAGTGLAAKVGVIALGAAVAGLGTWLLLRSTARRTGGPA